MAHVRLDHSNGVLTIEDVPTIEDALTIEDDLTIENVLTKPLKVYGPHCVVDVLVIFVLERRKRPTDDCGYLII